MAWHANGAQPNGAGGKRVGRTKGTPNKLDVSIREMVLGALSDVGGREYLAKRALDTPGPFLALVGKILPTQIVGDADGSPITLHLIAAQSVAAELALINHADHTQPRTIDGEAEAVPLLDRPPPLE